MTIAARIAVVVALYYFSSNIPFDVYHLLIYRPEGLGILAHPASLVLLVPVLLMMSVCSFLSFKGQTERSSWNVPSMGVFAFGVYWFLSAAYPVLIVWVSENSGIDIAAIVFGEITAEITVLVSYMMLPVAIVVCGAAFLLSNK